ncbi:DUF7683 domain-containing protein [Kiloniella sp. b19]|uniref:DUF7683 domain-containing protein n=1 Tax=Kiloniella sp. GXU_MW_B19 TaxID=3141326 RepID=UPI0031D5F20C
MSNEKNLVQVINCFDKETEDWVKRIILPKISLSRLRDLFGNWDPGDVLVGEYVIGLEEKDFFDDYVEDKTIFDKYSCCYNTHVSNDPRDIEGYEFK